MAKKLKNIIGNFFNNLVTKWLEDIFIFGGVSVIIGTTYTISVLIANYVLGLMLVLFGLIIARK